MDCIQLSLFGRTCPELSAQTAEKISEPCWKNLPASNSQTLLFLDLRGGADGAKPEQSPETDGLWLGDSLTLNIGESPREESASLLSQILEDNVPQKYYLSERACRGILVRASRRGKKLPDLLQTALLEMIEWLQRGRNAAHTLKIRSGCAGGGKMDVSYDVVGTLRANAKGHDPIVLDALPFDTTQLTSPQNGSNPHWGDPCHPLAAAAHPPAAVIRISDEEIPVQPMVLESNQVHATVTQNGICPTLPASMGLGGGYVPMVTERKIFDSRENGDGQIVPTITGDHENRITDYTAIAIKRKTFNEQSFSHYKESEKCSTLKAKAGNIGDGSECLVAEEIIRWIVRRLTPVECERLQGFPDGWTDIGEWTDTKGKKHKYADSPRYKALGNSIALPQWFWIAQKMKPYLSTSATLGSLFDGIGGFPLVWQKTYGNGTARWASEIEDFPIAVTKRRFGEE